MSPRDYKPSPGNGRGRDAQAPRYGSWMSFVSGLGFGLVVAFGVYLWSASLPPPSDLVDEARELTGTAASTPATAATDKAASDAVSQVAADAQADEAAAADATPYEAPRPTFDFYKILPEMEVPVPADESAGETADAAVPPAAETTPPAVPPAADAAAPPEPETVPPAADEGSYILQVGSFRSFDDAEAAKARLALRGISASVQRVVINGQDIWFRVHIGPLSDAATLRAVRMKLTELDVSFILLKVGGATAAPGR